MDCAKLMALCEGLLSKVEAMIRFQMWSWHAHVPYLLLQKMACLHKDGATFFAEGLMHAHVRASDP